MTYTELQNEIVKSYRIKLDPNSTCRLRTHAHHKERRICKWIPEDTMRSTFTLLHEVGHVETFKASMRRSESEWYATIWAIDRCKEYGLEIPDSILHIYQRYIILELYRGLRRHGKGYGEMNIYKYAGVNKSAKELKDEFPWAAWALNGWE